MTHLADIAEASGSDTSSSTWVACAAETPVGTLRLVASASGLAAVLWPDDRAGRVRVGAVAEGNNPLLQETKAQLRAYFAGRLQRFDLALDPAGTDFQKIVWAALSEIPFGETRSYRDVASAIGRPTATRAVGAASGRNPLCIVVPCHRVVGASGALTGFAGGLKAKRVLLALEECGAGRLF